MRLSSILKRMLIVIAVSMVLLAMVLVYQGSMSEVESKPVLMICCFCLFFTVTSLNAFRRDKIFTLYYSVLFIYGLFTQIGYVLYPDQLSVVSKGQYYGTEWFDPFWWFTFLSFVSIFICFLAFTRFQRCGLRLVVKLRNVRNARPLFYLFVLIYNAIMAYFLQSRYQELSYRAQQVLKSNKLFFFGFSFYPLLLLVLYTSRRSCRRVNTRFIFNGMLSGSLILFVAIAVRSGQRIQMVETLFGILVYEYLSASPKRKWCVMTRILAFSLLFLVFQSALRYVRGGFIGFSDVLSFVTSGQVKISAGDPLKPLVFQDYLCPSLTLVTSMRYKLVSFGEVMRSNITNIVVLADYPTLGAKISRMLDPLGSWGTGYYFITEGFNAMGWWGIVYNGLVFNAGLYLWRRLFYSNDQHFSHVMAGGIATRVFSVVRGQSFSFVKSIYVWLAPLAILLALATNARIKITTMQPSKDLEVA